MQVVNAQNPVSEVAGLGRRRAAVQADQPFEHRSITDLNISKVGEQRLDLRVRGLLGHGVEELAARPLGFEEAVEQRFELRIHKGLSWCRKRKASNRRRDDSRTAPTF